MKKKDWIKIGIAGMIILLGCVWFTCTIGWDIISIALDPLEFQKWIDELGVFGWMVMSGLIFLQIVIAWLPGEIFEVGAGYAFGFWEGSFLVLLGSFLASWFVIFMVRRFGTRIVYHFFPKEKIDALPFLHDQKKLDKFIFIAFFIPGSPKDILTYAIGLTDMKISHFLFLSTVGRIPSVITSTITGSALGVSNYTIAIASFAITLIISALGLWGYGKYTSHKASKPPVLTQLQKEAV